MHNNVFIAKINTTFTWITRLAYLNALWILFSLFGLVLLGFFPATIAMITICGKWISGNFEFRMFEVFKETFKKVFGFSNKLGWIFTSIGIILWLNFLVIQMKLGEVSIVIIFAFYLFVFFYIITLTHLFPVMLNYQVSLCICIKNAFIIGLVNMDISLLIIISQSALYYLMFSFPGTAIFFLGSILSTVQIWLAHRSFNRIDKRIKQHSL